MSSGSSNGNAEGPGGAFKPPSSRVAGSHSLPPPLPHSPSQPPRISIVDVAESPKARSRWVMVFAVLFLAIVGVGGALLRSKISSNVEEERVVAPAAAPTPAAPPPPPPTATAAPAAPVVEVSAQVTSENDPTACIESHFPPKALGDKSDLGFVCTEKDAWKIARQLEQRIVKAGNEAGLALWSHLGMYELAVAASLRSSCCTSAVPLEAPAPATPCGSLAERLRALGSEPNAEELAKYEKLIRCLLDRNVRFPKEYTEVGGEAMRTAVKTYFPASGGTQTSGAAGSQN